MVIYALLWSTFEGERKLNTQSHVAHYAIFIELFTLERLR